MKRGVIDDNVAGQIIGLPVGVVHGDCSGRECRRCRVLRESTGGFAGEVLWAITDARSAGNAMPECDLLSWHPWPFRSQIHRDGFSGEGGERLRPRNAGYSSEFSGTRETCLAARRDLIAGE